MTTIKEKHKDIEKHEFEKVNLVIHRHEYNQKSEDSIEFKFKTRHGTNTVKVFGNSKEQLQKKIKDYKKLILDEV